MFSKRRIIVWALATILIVVAFIISKSKKSLIATLEPEERMMPGEEIASISDSPLAAVTMHNTDQNTNGACASLRAKYASRDDIKNDESIDLRFLNVHKKIDGLVYRLRFFYKDSSENETPTYLVYKENQNEEDILTEKSAYKKGKLYNKVEQAQGEILYTEEGLNIGSNQNLFLHYENKVLKDLQGINTLSKESGFIECRY